MCEKSDKIEIYYDGALQRALYMSSNWTYGELDSYISQFNTRHNYEVYINGQLYDVGKDGLTFNKSELNIISFCINHALDHIRSVLVFYNGRNRIIADERVKSIEVILKRIDNYGR